MNDIRKDGPALLTITARGKTAQLQTMPKDGRLVVALNDGAGVAGAENGIVSGDVDLDRESVKALLQSCLDFLVMT